MKKHTTLAALAGLALTLTACGTTTSPAPTVTATKAVEKTPQACLDYIEVTEKVITSAGQVISAQKDGLDVSSEVIGNYGRPGTGDIARIQDATERIQAENETLTALIPEVQAAKTGCQAGN